MKRASLCCCCCAARLGLRKRLLALRNRLLQPAGRRRRRLQLLAQPDARGALLVQGPLDARRGLALALRGVARAVERGGGLGAAGGRQRRVWKEVVVA